MTWGVLHRAALVALLLGAGLQAPSFAQQPGYQLQPGDLLIVDVWRDEDLSREVLVAPDGDVSVPLAGNLRAAGRTLGALNDELRQRLSEYVEDPVVTVALKEVRGSRIYVLGKVNRPGMYLMDQSLDVMQALSLAGGMTPFADADNIRILRREGADQSSHLFEYNHVARGRRLEQNLPLKSGDTVVVN